MQQDVRQTALSTSSHLAMKNASLMSPRRTPYILVVSVKFDSRPKASLDVQSHRTNCRHKKTEWDSFTWRNLLSQPSLKILLPKLQPHLRICTFCNGEFYITEQGPAKNEQHVRFTPGCTTAYLTVNTTTVCITGSGVSGYFLHSELPTTKAKYFYRLYLCTSSPAQCCKQTNWIP